MARDSGAHAHREYGDTMFVWTGAAVDIPYKVYKLLGNLGFKIYFFRLPYNEKTEDELLEDMIGVFDEKRANIQSALYDYLAWFEIGPSLIYDEPSALCKIPWDREKDEKEVLRWIVKLATVLCHLRCIAQTWQIQGDSQGSNYGYTVSQTESPTRACNVLSNLARGHALLTGQNFITLEDIPIVVKTVLSTGSIDRVGLLDLLLRNDGSVITEEISESLKVSKNTALRIMTELWVIGLVDIKEDKITDESGRLHYTKRITLKKEFDWLLSKDTSILTIDNIEESTLTPIVCKFCERYATYIEFDLVIHLHETHGIGRGYLDTPPAPSIPSRSWSDDFRIRDVIIEGNRLGSELDEDSIEKLDMAYSKYLDKTPPQFTAHEAVGLGENFSIRLSSQQHTFAPIVSIDEFFIDDHDKPYSALHNHKLEQSPCYPIIDSKPAGRHFIMYYCEICQPEFANDSAVSNITLSVIEHHCKYKDPDRHKAEILARLALKSTRSVNNDAA